MKRLAFPVVLVVILASSLVLLPHTAASPGTTERVSVDSAGIPGNGPSASPSTSGDGRYVAFSSTASNLVSADTNNASDIFVHDRLTHTTERVSFDTSGNQRIGDSYEPVISSEGRHVAYTYGSQIFVYDRQTGVTEEVSVDGAGNPGNGSSRWPAMNTDGRYVAFDSGATNLVPGDTNGFRDVFVHDRVTGETTRVSVDSEGNEANAHSQGLPCPISSDGRYVAFSSTATNLVPGSPNWWLDVFVHDRETGVTEQMSVDSTGNPGNDFSTWAAMSADGRYVAFYSGTSNLVPGDTNPYFDVFVHDRTTGATTRTSLTTAGNQGNNDSQTPAMSADGRYVAFDSHASNLVPGDANSQEDAFVRDRDTDVDGIFDEPEAVSTTRVSVDSAGNEGNSWSDGSDISGNGRYVAFYSAASNLVDGDTNAASDVFVHDRGPSGPVGGIAELPDLAGPSAPETGTPAEASGSSATSSAVLAGVSTVGALFLTTGAWYLRRRRRS